MAQGEGRAGKDKTLLSPSLFVYFFPSCCYSETAGFVLLLQLQSYSVLKEYSSPLCLPEGQYALPTLRTSPCPAQLLQHLIVLTCIGT